MCAGKWRWPWWETWHQPPLCHQHHSEFTSALGPGNFLALSDVGSKIPKKLKKKVKKI